MKAKWFLQRAYNLQKEIEIKKEQIASIREALTNITVPTDKEHVSYTPESSPMANAISNIMELENAVEIETAYLVEVEREIIQVINQLDSSLTRSLMTKRYICFKSWNVILEELGVTDKWLFNRHSYALKEVERILESRIDPDPSADLSNK